MGIHLAPTFVDIVLALSYLIDVFLAISLVLGSVAFLEVRKHAKIAGVKHWLRGSKTNRGWIEIAPGISWNRDFRWERLFSAQFSVV
jgi:hypothetical protein